ncbi:MAG: SufD family Fe-S cluster assembly protein [Candidatus Enteromonas sp.]|nr:SufD family Fe-S cluster assembly protein [Candidatus Enteromonas sp.]
MDNTFVDSLVQDSEFLVPSKDVSRFLFARFEDSKNLHVTIHVQRDARAEIFFADFSSGACEIHFEILLEEEGASADFQGAFLSKGTSKKSVSVDCMHLAPRTSGLVENYGVVQDNGKLFFLGKSDIPPGSFASSTRQSAKIIVFDRGCIAKASPVLCIDENDVKASHAAVVGKLNEDHIYYLLSRGLSLQEARRLISMGYLLPIAAHFGDGLKERIVQAIEGDVNHD